MIAWLVAQVLPWLLAAVAALGGLLAYGRHRERKGRADRDQDAMEFDHDKADDMRRRVERDPSDRLRRYDDAGYRD